VLWLVEWLVGIVVGWMVSSVVVGWMVSSAVVSWMVSSVVVGWMVSSVVVGYFVNDYYSTFHCSSISEFVQVESLVFQGLLTLPYIAWIKNSLYDQLSGLYIRRRVEPVSIIYIYVL
jgi:hypothetical protein